MSYLDVLKSVVQGGAAARTGYLTGQDQERDKVRQEARQDAAVKRQSRLDEIKAVLEQSQAAENSAQAEWYRKRDTTPKAETPHFQAAEEGLLRWDPEQKKLVPTGFHPPERAAARGAARADAREARIEKSDRLRAMGGEVADLGKQIGETTRQIGETENARGLKSVERKSRIGELIQLRNEYQRTRDSTVAARRSPSFESTPGATVAGRVMFDPTLAAGATPAAKTAPSRVDQLRNATAANPAQGDYDAATAKYQKALSLGIDPASARAAYDATLKLIAQRHGQVK